MYQEERKLRNLKRKDSLGALRSILKAVLYRADSGLQPIVVMHEIEDKSKGEVVLQKNQRKSGGGGRG